MSSTPKVKTQRRKCCVEFLLKNRLSSNLEGSFLECQGECSQHNGLSGEEAQLSTSVVSLLANRRLSKVKAEGTFPSLMKGRTTRLTWPELLAKDWMTASPQDEEQRKDMLFCQSLFYYHFAARKRKKKQAHTSVDAPGKLPHQVKETFYKTTYHIVSLRKKTKTFPVGNNLDSGGPGLRDSVRGVVL